jgi:hypothetical protein
MKKSHSEESLNMLLSNVSERISDENLIFEKLMSEGERY